jgi:hypothetical protein
LLSVETNMDVTFCPCFLKMRLGNLQHQTLSELWNVEPLVELRRCFSRGDLPAACQDQLCPPARS